MKKSTVSGLTGVLILTGVLFVWFGVYNIAATEEHWPLTTGLLEVIKERSIQMRSKAIVKPDTLPPEYMAKGAEDYAAMCAQCHLAPGNPPTELQRGLYPRPPVFHELEHEAHGPGENFWVIKNGIKLTGMPAWNATHSDEEIWGLVAFIEQLPGMTADEYRKATVTGAEMPVDQHNTSSDQHGH